MNRLLPLLLLSASLAGCNRDELAPPASVPGLTPVTESAEPPPAPMAAASAMLKPASGSNVTGTVTFTETADGMQVVADISGLAAGAHGFHIHEKGDCSDPKAESAGPHFNPHGAAHGAPDSGARHAGDLGNLTADDSGNATVNNIDKILKLSGAESIIGRAVIVHASPDDLKSQPSGNAGARLACGVIEAATPAP